LLCLLPLGVFLLLRFDPVALLVGFAAPFVVILLKGLSLGLLTSRVWRRLTGTRQTGALLVIVLLFAAAVMPMLAAAKDPPAHSAATESHDASHAETHVAGAHEGEHAAPSGPQELPNFITLVIAALGHDHPVARFLHTWENVIFALLIALALVLVARAATRGATTGVPSGLQNLVETLVEFVRGFIVDILGEKAGRRYLPYLGTVFVYILFMNLLGLIPFMKSPTSSLNIITAALAITTFVYVQIEGLRNLGLVGYLDHLAGQPRSVVQWAMVPIMLPVHVLGELAKPISLACRLFGNVFGEDMLLVAFIGLGAAILAAQPLPIGIPLQFPFLLLALMTSTLQAMIFTVLSTIYFLLMLPHDEHAEEAHH
jgi:F-type H+-transporting ATPase subunit a